MPHRPATADTSRPRRCFASSNQVELDIHGAAALGGKNGVPPEVPERPIVHFAARLRDRDKPDVPRIGVCPPTCSLDQTSKVCSNPTTIQQHGFNLRTDYGNTGTVNSFPYLFYLFMKVSHIVRKKRLSTRLVSGAVVAAVTAGSALLVSGVAGATVPAGSLGSLTTQPASGAPTSNS